MWFLRFVQKCFVENRNGCVRVCDEIAVIQIVFVSFHLILCKSPKGGVQNWYRLWRSYCSFLWSWSNERRTWSTYCRGDKNWKTIMWMSASIFMLGSSKSSLFELEESLQWDHLEQSASPLSKNRGAHILFITPILKWNVILEMVTKQIITLLLLLEELDGARWKMNNTPEKWTWNSFSSPIQYCTGVS